MADTTENVLYVIFHGLISLIDIGDAGFNAYMFDMRTDHRYLFGSWLIEIDSLEQNSSSQDPVVLTLDSVDAAARTKDNTLDPDLNLVIKLDAPLPTKLPGARAVIQVPRPRKIYYYTCGDAQRIIDGDKSRLVNGDYPSTISETRVFEYTFKGSPSPRLLAGDPPPAGSSSVWPFPKDLAPVGFRQVATLHFYNEPDVFNPNTAEEHARAEFLLSTAILGVPMKLTAPSQGDVPPPAGQPDLRALGILQQEVTPLDGRNDALLDFQYLARTGQPRPNTTGGGGGPICGGGNAQVVQLSGSPSPANTTKN